MADLDTNTPLGSEVPRLGDDRIRELKAAIQERLDVDHYMALTGSAVASVASGGGKHRKVTFRGTISTPTPAAGELLVYTKDVGGGQAELFAVADGWSGGERQLTSDGFLLLVAGDLTAGLVDDVTIGLNGANELEVKDQGIDIAQLNPGVVDDETIEIDPTDGLRVKEPAAPSGGGDNDAQGVGVALHAWGVYAGNSTAGRQINCGFLPRHVRIKGDGDGRSEVAAINASPPTTWLIEDGTIASAGVDAVTFHANGFIVETGTRTNLSGQSYIWHAIGSR